ncbi:MAG TPA: metallophosphoesterase [Patescibacteria group bacterium]|nr:metallophosphoesterase [Patescibacteria group bacterium]
MTVIAHLSDPHFGTQVEAVVDALRSDIAAQRPDIVVISGDLTQRARAPQFAATRAFADSLGAPVCLAVPGNHDIPLYDTLTRIANPRRLYKKFFGQRNHLWQQENLGLVCLDATSPLRHTRGKTQMRIARRLLESARARLGDSGTLCVVEHQPLDVALEQDRHEALINAQETARLFAEMRVDLVMSGHVHMPLLGTTAAAFPALPRHFILSGAGTAVSYRTRSGAPNSYHLITLQDEAAKIALQAFHADSNAFVTARQSLFRRGGGGWTDDGGV